MSAKQSVQYGEKENQIGHGRVNKMVKERKKISDNSGTEELINSPYKIKSKSNLPQNIQKRIKNAIGIH